MLHFKYAFIVFFMMLSVQAKTQKLYKNGSIFIVRHAEKSKGKDPALTEEGKRRSEDLFQRLKKYAPALIFVSQYKRSVMTADSLRLKMKVDTVHYFAEESGDDVVNLIRSRLQDSDIKRILVIGHSNTIPAIIKHYIPDAVIDISDDTYDDLFEIRFKKGKAFLYRSKYGKASVANGKNSMILQ